MTYDMALYYKDFLWLPRLVQATFFKFLPTSAWTRIVPANGPCRNSRLTDPVLFEILDVELLEVRMAFLKTSIQGGIGGFCGLLEHLDLSDGA